MAAKALASRHRRVPLGRILWREQGNEFDYYLYGRSFIPCPVPPSITTAANANLAASNAAIRQ